MSIAAVIAIMLALAQPLPAVDAPEAPPQDAWVLVGRACFNTEAGPICQAFTSRNLFPTEADCQAQARPAIAGLQERLAAEYPAGGRIDAVCVTVAEYMTHLGR